MRLDREVRQRQQHDHANRRENAFVEALRLVNDFDKYLDAANSEVLYFLLATAQEVWSLSNFVVICLTARPFLLL